MADDRQTPLPLIPDRLRAAAIRSKLMLETASELVGRADFVDRQARVLLREQGATAWRVGLAGSDAVESILDLDRGEVQFGIVNPAVGASLALRGTAPFPRPVAIRAIATMPSWDVLGLAVRASYGIDTVQSLREARPPLRISLRGQRDHSVHAFVAAALEASGIAPGDLEAWGGVLRYDDGLPHAPLRSGLMAGGEIDALFDEGTYNWVEQAADAGFRFLSLGEEALARLEALGHRRAVLPKARFARLERDVATIDFSGFLVYTHADVPDELVRAFCAALDARRDRIPWQGGWELPLERMVEDRVDAPITVPFHPAAEAYWRERGILR